MFAVIKSGGKQYKVRAGDVIKLEKVPGKVGALVEFPDVIAITNDKGQVTLGSPIVSGAYVSGIILEHGKDDKVLIFKKRRRHNYRRKKRHRQHVTWLRVKEIKFGAASQVYQEQQKKAAEAKPKTKPAKEKTTNKED